MFKKGVYCLFVVVVLVLCAGCSPGTAPDGDGLESGTGPDGPGEMDGANGENGADSADGEDGAAGENGKNGDKGDTEIPDWNGEEAASALPEPWMAYPGSLVDVDWFAQGLSEFPAWLLVVPPDTTREEVIEYYLSVAEERDDFEAINVYHGIAGDWLWKEYEILIETDFYLDDPDLVQITFAFKQALD